MGRALRGSTSQSDCVPAEFLLEIDARQVSALFPLLREGFILEAKLGCSIKAFLHKQLGLNSDYVDKHISTVFLDGRPVDDLDAAVIRDGSHIALSSAMPGLVGATMRRGGLYATFRSSITYTESGITTNGEGLIVLKLFNLVTEDLGETFLRKGILLKSSDLKDFLVKEVDFLKGCRRVVLGKTPVGPDGSLPDDFGGGCDLVRLTIRVAES